MEEVWIDVEDDGIWTRTLAALRSSRPTDLASVFRGRQCRCVLGHAGMVPGHGPMFTSSWSEPRFSGTVVNGEPWTVRQLRRSEADDPRVEVLEPGDSESDAREAVVALLLLTDARPEYPTLLVRCPHGDAIVDRPIALAAAQAKRPPSGKPATIDVTVGHPLSPYRRHHEDWGDGEGARTDRRTTKRRFGPGSTE